MDLTLYINKILKERLKTKTFMILKTNFSFRDRRFFNTRVKHIKLNSLKAFLNLKNYTVKFYYESFTNILIGIGMISIRITKRYSFQLVLTYLNVKKGINMDKIN